MKRCIHFTGIGGIGMSGLARIFREQGCAVTGSDRNISTAICQKLQSLGVTLFRGQKRENISRRTDLLIYTAAIGDDNAELQAARQRGIPCLPYARMVGKLMKAKIGIGVSGTHGKTTTTGIFTSILRKAGKNPGYLIGGEMDRWGGNGSWGQGRYFVVEACEFARSFHSLFPQHVILTNLEREHMDYYSSLEEIQEAFRHFLARLPQGGVVVHPANCPNMEPVVNHPGLQTVSFHLHRDSGADVYADRISYGPQGADFDVFYQGKQQGALSLRLLGEHNVKNALAAYALARKLRIPHEAIARGLKDFRGVSRRLDLISQTLGISIIDDYGHHPTEIKAVLQALRQRFSDSRIFLVFQPHQYSRTYRFLAQFALTLTEADRVILPEIYASRDKEEDKARVNSYRLCKEVNLLGGNARFMPQFDEIVNFLSTTCEPGDVVLTMGAGNINQVAYQLRDRLVRSQFKTA